jgi:hypothetical protein
LRGSLLQQMPGVSPPSTLRPPGLLYCRAAHYGGRILVARESAISGGGSGELIDAWEPLASADAVQTPAEVYRGLRAEGHRVQYFRIPVTDGRAPAPEDIDSIMEKVGGAGCWAAAGWQAGEKLAGAAGSGGRRRRHTAALLLTLLCPPGTPPLHSRSAPQG